MKKVLKLSLYLIALVIAGALALYYYIALLGNTPITSKSKYTVEPNTRFSRVVEDLVGKQPSWRVAAYAKLHPELTKLYAGAFNLEAENVKTLNDALKQLTSYSNTILIPVALVPSRTWSQWKQAMSSLDSVQDDITSKTDAQLIKDLGLTAIDGDKKFNNLEGYFSPNTYNLAINGKLSTVLQFAYNNLKKDLAQAWEERDKSIDDVIHSPYELLILASLIEKEKGNEEEAQDIASVFINRLRFNMPLQTDPTIIYGLGSSYRGTIYRSDLKKDTPYNTYIHKGLTPTPIAIPSKATLMQAAHPNNTKYLYFVAQYGQKAHNFAQTLAEHNANVAAYKSKANNPDHVNGEAFPDQSKK